MVMSPLTLAPGTLWASLQHRTDEALRSGALQPIATRSEMVDDAGVRFLVRVVSSLARKAAARVLPTAEPGAADGASPFNPFLPYNPAMVVADVSDTHVALLNKFNVVDHHLLVVTRAFEEQESRLTLADFEALCACLAEIDGLGFHNSGAPSGASQRHKHLQLVPLPLASSGPSVPVEALFASPLAPSTAPSTLPGLPFRHALCPLALANLGPLDAAASAHDRYLSLLQATGVRRGGVVRGADRGAGSDGKNLASEGSDARLPPYNLLMTRRWMLLVPRSAEHFDAISVNALGFAGALLVRDEAALARLKAAGPMRALTSVSRPGAR